MIPAAAFLLASTAFARETGHADLLTRYADLHSRLESISARIEVRMTHSVAGSAESGAPPPERYAFRVKAIRDHEAGERAQEHWIVEVRGIEPRTALLRYSRRAVWTMSASGRWERDPSVRAERTLKMLAVARGWAYQYLEDLPETWSERAKINILSGDHAYAGQRGWLLEIIPRMRLMQTAMAARWEVVMSYQGLPLYSRSTDRAGREVTVITSRDWRRVEGLPVCHDFTIVVRPPEKRRPDEPDVWTALDCRLSDVDVKVAKKARP